MNARPAVWQPKGEHGPFTPARPTTIEPSALTAYAALKNAPPGRSPKGCIPLPEGQRNGPQPATNSPSAETPRAAARVAPPGRSPISTAPVFLVQMNATMYVQPRQW